MQSSVLWCFHLSSVLVHCSASSEVPKQWCTGVCCCMGLSAEVSSPHLVLHKYALHPSGLRYGSGGKKSPKAKAARGDISVWCAKYFSGKYEEEVYGKYISSLLNCGTDAGCLWSKENKKLMGRTQLSWRLLWIGYYSFPLRLQMQVFMTVFESPVFSKCSRE